MRGERGGCRAHADPRRLTRLRRPLRSPEEKDPVEPFSVFGTVYKKYVIDVLDEATGRQIVGRKRGFTAEACVDVISERQQRFRVPGEGGSLAPGGPTVAAVASAGAASGNYASESVPVQRSRVCTERVVEGSISKTDEMLPACVPACRSSCARAISAYDAEQRRTVGFGFTEKDAARVKGSCAAQCEKNCGIGQVLRLHHPVRVSAARAATRRATRGQRRADPASGWR